MIPRGKEVKRARYTMIAIFCTAIVVSLAFALIRYDFDNLHLTNDRMGAVNSASITIDTDKGM